MSLNNSTLPLTQFAIYGLYGERHIVIPFNHPAKILVSENGVGKTTVLNALYTVLTCQFFKLAALDFEKIVLKFSHDNMTIRKSDLMQHDEAENNSIYKEIKQKLLDIDFIALMDLSREFPLEKFKAHPRLQSAAKALEIPPKLLATQFRNFSTGLEEGDLLAISEKIKSLFNYKVLYFPTFRRIEENLSNLGYFSQSPNDLLQSGMSDVNAHIERTLSDIEELVVGWFLALAANEQLFTQVVKDMTFLENNEINIESQEDLKMALEGIGETTYKNGIEATLKLIDFSKIEGLKPSTVEDFLSNTLQIYHQEQKKQNAIKAFITVCNRYFFDKQFVYDDKQVKIEIVLTKNNRPITLEKLSSGEKQIVSLFSKLYLDSTQKNIVLLDEPELSISMEWQKRLLPDILDSPQCHGVIAATHSPFIFNNELNAYTVALNEYIEEIE